MTARFCQVAYGAPFLKTVANELWQAVSGCPEGLAHSKVVLPTRRAARTFVRELVTLSQNKAVLLPEIITLSDQNLLSDGAETPEQNTLVERLRIVEVLQKSGVKSDEAWRMADSLHSILKEMALYGVDFQKVQQYLPQDQALHWQQISHHLCLLLKSGLLEELQGPQKLLTRLLEQLQKRPTKGVVMVAGLVSAYPKALELYRFVSAQAAGLIIFPPIIAAHHLVKPSHPAAIVHKILADLGISSSDIPCIGMPSQTHCPATADFLSAAFADDGLKIDQAKNALDDGALQAVALVEAADESEEAEIIALHIRDLLAKGEKNIALITPLRLLANRVMTELTAAKVVVDDTAGRPLRHTEVGVLTLLALDLMAGTRSPHALLAVLKHPLVCLGENRAEHLETVRAAEVEARNPLKPISLVQQSLIRQVLDMFGDDKERAPLALWAERLKTTLSALTQDQLWLRAGGDEVSALLHLVAGYSLQVNANEFKEMVANHIFTATIHQVSETQSHVQVYGLYEAQFQHFDCVVLAGLVEGVWPGLSADDPWLPAAVRHALQLPTSSHAIGLAADIFCQQLASHNVLITRSRKLGGSPQMPSRFLERIDALLSAHGAASSVRTRQELLAWRQHVRRIDKVKPSLAPQPAPRPEVRPTTFSATQLRLLMQNPYGFYAREILRLSPLAELEVDFSPALLGSLVHDILEQDVRRGWRNEASTERLKKLQHYAGKVLAPWSPLPWVRHIVTPRVQAMLRHYVEHDAREVKTETVFSELQGEASLTCSGRQVRFRAKLDCLKMTEDGAHVIDYKTGLLPTKKAVEQAEDPQLFLEAYILAQGGYGEIGAQLPLQAELWRFTPEGVEVLAAPKDITAWLEKCEAIVLQVMENYLAGAPLIAPTSGYQGWIRHLARVDEWHM